MENRTTVSIPWDLDTIDPRFPSYVFFPSDRIRSFYGVINMFYGIGECSWYEIIWGKLLFEIVWRCLTMFENVSSRYSQRMRLEFGKLWISRATLHTGKVLFEIVRRCLNTMSRTKCFRKIFFYHERDRCSIITNFEKKKVFSFRSWSWNFCFKNSPFPPPLPPPPSSLLSKHKSFLETDDFE